MGRQKLKGSFLSQLKGVAKLEALRKLYRFRYSSTMTEEYVTTEEAARIAKVTTGRIRQLLLKGRLKGKHFGRDWMVERNNILEFVSSPRKTGRPPIDKV